MSDFDPAADFAAVIDFQEAVTLERRDESASTAISAARRYSCETREAMPSAGIVTAADARWQFTLPTGETEPVLGDVLVDTLTHRWTILTLKRLTTIGLWECETRELRIAGGLSDRVDLERATYVEENGEMVVDSWTTVATDLPARIQPITTRFDRTTAPPTISTELQIVFGGAIALEPEDRLVGEDGTIYWIERVEQAERIDVLPVVSVVREE